MTRSLVAISLCLFAGVALAGTNAVGSIDAAVTGQSGAAALGVVPEFNVAQKKPGEPGYDPFKDPDLKGIEHPKLEPIPGKPPKDYNPNWGNKKKK